MKLVEAIIPNGEVVWNNEQPEVPTTTERDGNVTVNRIGTPAKPGYFSVSFRMRVKFELNGVEDLMFLTPIVPVFGLTKSDPQLAIEDRAVLQLPAMFRALADELERQVADFDIPSVSDTADGSATE